MAHRNDSLVIVMLVAAVMAASSRAEAGPYMTGLGMGGGSMNLFPDGLVPHGSAPLFVGGGFTRAGDHNVGHVRIGIGILWHRAAESLAAPRWCFVFDLGVHLADDSVVTYGFSYQHGIGPLLVGGGVALADSMADDEALGIVFAPELSLPLRWRVTGRFTPAAVLYARLELAATARETFDDRVMTGVSVALW